MTEEKLISNLRDKIEKNIEPMLTNAWADKELETSTKKSREQIIKLVHYYHILQIMGADKPDVAEQLEVLWGLYREKVRKAKDSKNVGKEIALSNLVDEHTRAWNMAEYYYEKASKILCQMMITAMDYLLQERAKCSMLYNEKQQGNYFLLVDEIAGLSRDYESCYYFLCVFDYCTEKMAEFTGISEYKQMIKEHERIKTNGLPGKVKQTLRELEIIAGLTKKDYFIDINRSFHDEPKYDKELLDKLYDEVVKEYNNEVVAMTVFANFVIKLDEYYELKVGE